MAFTIGSLEGEKVFDGVVFPKTLLPPSTLESPSVSDLVEIVKREREWITDALQQDGAILLRGFGLTTAEDFSRVVDALGWDDFGYRGAVARNKAAERVFTSNESPIHISIGFHHEMALIKDFPKKLLTYCVTPSPEGGQTGIVRSDVVVKKMEEIMPDVVERLEREGMCFIHRREGPVWKRLLKTEDPAEAEKCAIDKLQYCNSVKINDDGNADIFYGPFNPIREIDGKRVWFNTIVGYVTEQADLNATYGDGTPIPSHVLEAYWKVLADNCVDVDWQTGDLVLINNLLVQHARRPGKPPRTVLVALCN